MGSSDHKGWARHVSDGGQAFADSSGESGLAGTEWASEHDEVTRFKHASQFEA
jgi:hypothetical protein